MSASYHVALDERSLVGHAGLLRQPARQRDQVGVVLDADAAGAAPGGGDDVAAVAGSEVHRRIVGRDLGQVEHRLDQSGRGRHPDRVLAGLADGEFDRLGSEGAPERDREARQDADTRKV